MSAQFSSAELATHGRFSRRSVFRSAGLLVLAAAAVVAMVVPSQHATADPSAAAVVRQWSDQLAGGTFKPAVFTATQGGGPNTGAPGAAYAAVTLRRDANGLLSTGKVNILFSGRQAVLSGRPVQPFDAAAADVSEFTLTLSGDLVERSHTWGFTQTIPLHAIGNNMLAGWGASIGNSGAPAYWVIAVDPRVYPIPARTAG